MIGTSTFYHYDGLGSTVAVTDEDEQVVESYSYDAFGDVTVHTGDAENPFLYVGELGYYADWLDGAVCDYYVRARTYNPTIARWLSVDPHGFDSDDDNLVRYVGNQPLRFSDPSGEEHKCDWGDCLENLYWDFHSSVLLQARLIGQ